MSDPRYPRRQFLRAAASVAAGASGAGLLASCDTHRKEPYVSADPSALPVALLTDPICAKHLAGIQHPEQPARLDAIGTALAGLPLRKIPVRPATESQILEAHTKTYYDLVCRDIASGREMLSTGDTSLSSDTLTAALAAAGAAVAAVDTVVAGPTHRAFCAVRPPGHHAGISQGMGFCVFNNAAIAARHARTHHGLERVLIVDWDVHHGNGTQEVFWRDGRVFYFSTHQSPWYPFTGAVEDIGAGDGEGTTMNRPLLAGAGRDEILGAFEDDLAPAMDTFRPQLVIISAGFDSRAGDPLGGFRLRDQDFADLTDCVLAIARKHATGRVVSVLEGGYALAGLASATKAHVERLCKA